MKENVTIRLAMTQVLDRQKDHSAYEYAGVGVKKAGGWFFTYKEQLEEGVVVQTVVKIGHDEVTLLRQGGVQMRQLFKTGEHNHSTYQSPYSVFNMETKTKRLHVQWENERPVAIRAEYRLWMNGQSTGAYDLKLSFNWHEK